MVIRARIKHHQNYPKTVLPLRRGDRGLRLILQSIVKLLLTGKRFMIISLQTNRQPFAKSSHLEIGKDTKGKAAPIVGKTRAEWAVVGGQQSVIFPKPCFAQVAEWYTRSAQTRLGNHVGSSPTLSTKTTYGSLVKKSITSPCHGEGQGFESPTSRQYSRLVQQVEQPAGWIT